MIPAATLPQGVAGYALRWGEWSRQMPGACAAGQPRRNAFRERFTAGAFAASLAGADIELHSGHDGLICGSTKAGTLAVWEDQWGLAFAAQMDGEPKVPAAGVSVQFQAAPGGIAWNGDEATVTRASLVHIALIANAPSEPPPAYPGAVAWFTSWPDHAVPDAVASLRARWETGRARRLVPRPAPPAPKPAPRPAARTQLFLPPHILALMDDEFRSREKAPREPFFWLGEHAAATRAALLRTAPKYGGAA